MPKESEPSPLTTNRRILVVDDDQLLLDAFHAALNPPVNQRSRLEAFIGLPAREQTATDRFQVTTASQGEEALAKMANALQQGQPFAAAFVDVRMPPGMDGVETIQRIRAMDEHIHLIVVTAFSDHRADDMQAVAKHHVILARKPLTSEEILQLARNACNAWQQEWTNRNQQTALSQLGKSFLASRQAAIEDIAFQVLETSRSLSHSPHGLVAEIDPLRGDLLIHAHTSGLLPLPATTHLIRQNHRPCWWVLDHQTPLLVNFPQEASLPLDLSGLALPLQRYLVVPVVRGNSTVGVILVANSPQDYTIADQKGLERIADLFAIVLDRVNLERQLRHVQKLDAIGTLSAGIAHDFNNILGVILGYAEISLCKLTPEDAIHPFLQEINKAVLRGKTLVEQLLTFSRKGESHRLPLSLAPLMREVAAFIRNSTPPTMAVQTSIGADEITILADASQIHQLVMNLCINAHQAMPDEQGTLQLSLKRMELGQEAASRLHVPPGSYALIQVKDDGIGMSDEVKERIFDPFFTTKEVGKGSGLGLSVAHGIVLGHGGAIAVESQLQAGSTFRVYLPLLHHPLVEQSLSPSHPPPSGQGHVLIVDDEPQLVYIYQKILTSYGYQVSATTQAQEALQWFDQAPHRFGAAVVDQAMPHMNGLDLARHFKKYRPDLPIILCTGLAAHEPLDTSPVDHTLQKPVSGKELAILLASLLPINI